MKGRPKTKPLLLASLLLPCLCTHTGADSGRITVVYTSEAAPYSEALEGLRSALPGIKLATVDLQSPNASTQLVSSLDASNRLIITIGGDALEAVSARKLDTPLLATMIMHSEQAGRHVAGAIHLDIPIAEMIGHLKMMFPNKTRAAIVRNPALPNQLDNAALARARQQGLTIQVSDASNPEELLKLLHSLKGQVDFILCLPDSRLYNSTTVKPIILASLESRLLIVGFSQSFVRAGAAVGIYPDFRDVGAQTAEIAQRQLARPGSGMEEGPRKIVVAINQRVIRLLGIDWQALREEEVVIFK